MMYRRSGNYTERLKEIKAAVDPHSIMNPGKLCF
jgi:FAD/FMN-containing dehydrogenase